MVAQPSPNHKLTSNLPSIAALIIVEELVVRRLAALVVYKNYQKAIDGLDGWQ
jgi:hypothetical protein